MKIIEGTEEGLSRSEEGIRAIRGTMRYALIDEEVTKNTIHRYKPGHRDIMDNLLFFPPKPSKKTLSISSIPTLTIGRT